MITSVMAGQSKQENKVTLKFSSRNVDACLEVETLLLCVRPNKSWAMLLGGGGKKKDAEVRAGFGSTLV